MSDERDARAYRRLVEVLAPYAVELKLAKQPDEKALAALVKAMPALVAAQTFARQLALAHDQRTNTGTSDDLTGGTDRNGDPLNCVLQMEFTSGTQAMFKLLQWREASDRVRASLAPPRPGNGDVSEGDGTLDPGGCSD